MLDFRFIKDNLEAVKKNIVDRNMNCDADLVVQLFDKRTELVTSLQASQTKRNDNAKAMKGKSGPASLLPQFYLYQSYNEFHQDQIVVPPLFMIKCDKNEKTVFKERAKKYQDRFASTFKDSSCLNKWKKQNDNIERNNSMNIDLDMVRGSK